ncbi:MAG: hypothetical protein ACE5I5_03335 [Candidatus Heimdallarchaeota archaeon]
MTTEEAGVNLKVQLMKLSSELRIVNNENLNLKKRLNVIWEEKQALEQALQEKGVEIKQIKDSVEPGGLSKAAYISSQSQELISLEQTLKEQTNFLESLSSELTELLVFVHSTQSLPEPLKQRISEIERLLWTEGLPEQKILVALIRHGGQLPRSDLQAKCSLSSAKFERSLNSLRMSRVLTETGTDLVELTAIKPVTVPSSKWGQLAIPEIFQQVRTIIETTKDATSITKALNGLRDVLFLKGVSPQLGYKIEAEAREWRSGSVTKQELLSSLSDWEAQVHS